MRLPESARAVLLFEHAATVWRVHMSRMIRMGSMQRCLNQCGFCAANPLQFRTQSITDARHLHRTPSHSMAINHTPSHSIALHRTPSHSIALHRNPSQSIAAAGAPFEHAAGLQHAGFEQVLGWLCALEIWVHEDGEVVLLTEKLCCEGDEGCTEGSRV